MTNQKNSIDYYTMASVKRIHKFRVIERIEKGNYSEVYKVMDRDRILILKIAREGCPEFNSLLAREFQILSNINHPNIVRVYEYEMSEDNRSFFTMEYINGRPINEYFNRFNEEFINAMIQVINALAAFHNKGFVHSDLKPEHIIYDAKNKKAVIIDFGFAGITAHQIRASGTLGYIAPEILKGIGSDQRSDLYSLGVIIYEILTGNKPLLPYSPVKDIPDVLNKTIERLLSEEPNLRPTAPELYETLINLLPRKEIESLQYKIYPPPTVFVEIPEIIDKLMRLEGESVVVFGELGAGKTRLLKELKYRFLFKNTDVLLCTVNQGVSLYDAICDFIGFKDINFMDKADKLQIYMEIAERLIEFAKDRSVVLLVDDIDNLTDYELGLFRYIAHSVDGTKITVIGTSKVEPRIRELNLFELYLRHFTKEEVRTLIERTYFELNVKGKDGLDTFTEWLHSFTGGNPFFIVETLKNLYEQDILRFEDNKWQIDMNLLKEFKPPTGIEEIISNRIKGLNEEESKVLKVLCIAGQPIFLPILNKIFPASGNISIEVLKLLGLIKEEKLCGQRAFLPSSQTVKMIMEKDLTPDELYNFSFELIKAIEGTGVDERFYPLLGRLYGNIYDRHNAYKYLIASAKYFEGTNDYISAIKYYEDSLNYCKDVEPGRYYEMLLKLGDLHLRLNENGKAIGYYKEVINGSEELKAESLFGIANAYFGIGEYKEAINYFEDIIKKSNIKPERYVEILCIYGYLLSYIKNFVKGEAVLKESLDSSRRIGNPHLEAKALYNLATLEWFRNDFERAEEYCLESLEISEKHSLNDKSGYSANLLGSLYMQKGDIENALLYIDKAIEIFKKIKVMSALETALLNKSLCLLYKGDIERAYEILEIVYKDALKSGSKHLQGVALLNLGTVFEDAGNLDKAIEYYQKVLEIRPDSTYAIHNLSMAYLKKGDFYRAKDILTSGIKNFEDPYYLSGMGIISLMMGRIEEGERYIEESVKLIEEKPTEISRKIDIYLNAVLFYYEKKDFERAHNYALKGESVSPSLSKERIIFKTLIEVNGFLSGRVKKLDIEDLIKGLKEKNYLYYYALLKRIEIEARFEKGIGTEDIGRIAEDLSSLERILNTMGAGFELSRVQRLLLKSYPIIVSDYSKRSISREYLDTFSRLAQIIDSKLGDEDFISEVLDLIISATGAERGAIFINTEHGMEFVTGRNMDKGTIKDAFELSKTAIAELDKEGIVFVPDAISDPRFNARKSVLLNQIRTILCIPLVVEKNIIGAIYLDSRITGSMFNERDKDFLMAVSKILASIIDKSMVFENLREELKSLRDGYVLEIGKGYILGKSRAIKRIHKLIDALGPSDSPILITGETGVGKGMIARLIHLKSKRKDKKFVSINCGTIPETLLESELFGHKRGAFTGALTDKKGLLEEAEGGTVFFDEITNTSPAFQAKMLEAIDEKVIRRLGETQTRQINVRFLFATNKDIDIEVEEGRFRKDLFYRINVFIIKVPSLRERIEDIPILAKFFLDLKCKELNKKVDGFTQEAIRLLKEYPWPGNVRELQNVIERAVVLSRSRIITHKDIGLTSVPGMMTIRELTKDALINALNLTNWNINETARILGISRRTVYRHIERFNIQR